MGRKLNNIFLFAILLIAHCALSQNEGVKPPVVTEYKGDTSYANFNKLRFDVAKAQINLLKNGALLVRLKTNSRTIANLKKAGNIDLATQVERETQLTNKAIIRAYTQELKFCPVYFFNSDCSDSVKHKRLENIFVDTNLIISPSIVCNASFYLIAEQGGIYNSSLGIVRESLADKAVERGSVFREASVVIKNRYFIQVHKPFPYFQKGTNFKHFKEYIQQFNSKLQEFYTKNIGFKMSSELQEYVY